VRLLGAERALLGITGGPGAGKSTVSEWLVARLNERAGALVAAYVPMDGFHLSNAQLDRLGLRGRKGAPETFDVAGYVALLRRLHIETDHVVYAPEFDRSREESIAGAIAVRPEHRLVVTEGNYLLHDAPGWATVRPLLDETWFVEQNERRRLERLVARHVEHGKPPDLAERWATVSDQANADLVARTRSAADVLVDID